MRMLRINNDPIRPVKSDQPPRVRVVDTENVFVSDLDPDDEMFQRIMETQGGFPLEAAEIVGSPTQYEEADLAKTGLLALREVLGLAPIAGEALDLAELEQIRRTGEDFYGQESDPKVRAALTAAGLLVPNVLERPARAIGRAVKRVVPDQKLLDEYVDAGRYMLDQLKGTKAGSKIKTGVADEAITVKHGTAAGDLSADKIKLFEDVPTLGARPGKAKARETELEKPGGFYTARGEQGKFFGTDSKPHQIQLKIPKGSKFVDLSETGMATDVMSTGDLQKMYQDGYDYIIGKNITGFEEIIPLNPEILESFKYNYSQGGFVPQMKAVKRHKL